MSNLVDVVKELETIDPNTKEMQPAEFAAYVQEQTAALQKELLQSTRVDSLAKAAEVAKASFELSGTARVAIFRDPYQLQPQVAKAVDGKAVAKSFAALAHEMRDGGKAHAVLQKSEEAGARALVQKQGASELLARVAALFGVTEYEPDGDYYESLGYKVKDIICAVEQAARVEQAMQTLSGLLPAPAPVQQSASAEKAAVEKGFAWPVDMSPKRKVTTKAWGSEG